MGPVDNGFWRLGCGALPHNLLLSCAVGLLDIIVALIVLFKPIRIIFALGDNLDILDRIYACSAFRWRPRLGLL